MIEIYIKIGLSVIACFLHSIGFCALWHVKQTNPYMVTQRLYLLHLSFAENFHAFFLGLFNIFTLLGYKRWSNYAFISAGGGAYLWYLSVMILLTIDRFLTVYLNVRYLVVWSKHKTKLVLKLCFVVAFIANIFFLVFLKSLESSLKTLTIYLWFPIDNAFLIIAVVTYLYIIAAVFNRGRYLRGESTTSLLNTSSKDAEKDERKSNAGSIKSHNNAGLKSSYSWKTFLVPFLLIAAFALFIAFPDNTYFAYFVAKKKMPKILDTLAFSFYPTGIICDAIIYILCSRDVSKYWFRRLGCLRQESNTNK